MPEQAPKLYNEQLKLQPWVDTVTDFLNYALQEQERLIYWSQVERNGQKFEGSNLSYTFSFFLTQYCNFKENASRYLLLQILLRLVRIQLQLIMWYNL